jgi:hypothetical protein
MAPATARKTAIAGRLVGYARVSTDEQGTDPQLDELRAAGCATIFEEHGSGTDRSGPVVRRLLRDIHAGQTLVIPRLDRLARSVSQLLAVIEQLEEGECTPAACAIPSTPPHHRGSSSTCRCSVRSLSWSGP